MTQLNTLFTAWVETVYHRREHSETGQPPIERWSVISPRMPSTAQLREAFLWSEWRTVTKTGTVGLHGNKYEVDAVLIGRKVELVFDPFDLTTRAIHHFRELLKFLRHRAGLTQLELSTAAGYSESQISRLEQNQRASGSSPLPPHVLCLRCTWSASRLGQPACWN